MANESPEKLPPQSIEVEKSILGCLMIDQDAILKIVDFLLVKDFYQKSHQEIYQACQELFSKGETIDLLSLSNRLKEKGKIDEVGGVSYLTELVNSVPSPLNVINYAKIVQKKRILRDLIEASQEIGQMGYNEAEDVDILLDRAEKRIFEIAQKSLTQTFGHIKPALAEAFLRVDKLFKKEKVSRGVPTGFSNLDYILAGFQKSDFILLASRPSLGKTALALDFARHAAVEEKIPVGIFSLEMSRDQVADRLIAAQSEIDLWRLRTGRLSDQPDQAGLDDFAKLRNAIGILAEAPIYIDDSPILNVLQIKAMARRLQAEKGLGLLIIDYLQLIEPREQTASPVQQITEISRFLKSLARELNIPVLALSQLSRAVEKRSPQIPRLADLRESGSLEQDSDVVLFIYREDRYSSDSQRKNIADIIVAKHRNGPVGKVELFFDERVVSFSEIEKKVGYEEE